MEATPYDGPSGFYPNKGRARYPNPFYSIAEQYLPLAPQAQMWWANYFLMRFGFYRTAVGRISNYFITELNIECESEKHKKVYEEAFEKLFWKEQLMMAGVNLIGYGNAYVSIAPGFKRFLSCHKCEKVTSIDDMDDFTFDGKGKYGARCPKCNAVTTQQMEDKISRDPADLNIVYWNPREVELRHDKASGSSEYYWDYKADYVGRVTKANNKFYSKVVPKSIYEAIWAKKLFRFNLSNFQHLKLATPAALETDGRGVAPCIYMFDDFFMLQVLRRYNEAICFEDIAPFRVISMSKGENSQANPILHQSSNVWNSAVDNLIESHRRDPASYGKFPFPLEYQQLGGDGKNLAPIEMMEHAASNILNCLNCPPELFQMQLKIEAVGPALRLFENSWSVLPDNYNRMLQKMADVMCNLKGLTPAKVSLLPTTMADNMETKSIMGQLMAANAIAKSQFLNLYGLDYKDQLRKKMEEDQAAKEIQQEAQERDSMGDEDQQQNPQTSGSPDDVIQQAQELAQKLFPMDPSQRRQELQKIKATNQTLYSHTKQVLEEMTQQAKSQGVKQQGGS